MEEICAANPRGPGVRDVRRVVRIMEAVVSSAHAVGRQRLDTMSAGLEQSPHAVPASADVPRTVLGQAPKPKAPKASEWTEKDSEREWRKVGLRKDWQWQLHKEKTTRRAGWVLRGWLLPWVAKELGDQEDAEMVLDAALGENAYGGVWEVLKSPRPDIWVLSRLRAIQKTLRQTELQNWRPTLSLLAAAHWRPPCESSGSGERCG